MTDFPERGSVSIDIEASAASVWALLSDITRMGEWSPECVGGEWLDGATGPAVGAAFLGHNKAGQFEWSVPCEIVVCDADRAFEFVAPRGESMQTHWRFDLTPSADGTTTTVTESFDAPRINLAGAPSNFEGRNEMLVAGMTATLANLKAAAEA